MSRMSKLLFAGVGILAFGSVAEAEAPTFTLDSLATASQELSLTVPPSGTVPVRILLTGGSIPKDAVDLSLSEFASQQGMTVDVLMTIDGTTLPPSSVLRAVPYRDPLLAIHLRVPKLPTAGVYTGTLLLTIPGKVAGGTVWRIKLTSALDARPATLVLDQTAVTLTARRALCFPGSRFCIGRDEEPSVTVHVRDKGGLWPLDGLTARLEPGLKTPGGHSWDMGRDMVAELNGEPVADFGSSPDAGKRSVVARDQATIRLGFRNLVPGEYTIPLRFGAMNSGADDLQRLTVSILVRDSLWLAAIILVVAAIVSFLGTQVVTKLRLRAAFLDRINNMRPAWLQQEPPILAVIWLRAMVRQAENLSRRFWLTGQAEIDARLARAEGMLALLERAHNMRNRLERQQHEIQIQRRAQWALDRIVHGIEAAPLNEQGVARLKAEFDALEAWIDPTKVEAMYWADLLPVIQGLLREVRPEALPENSRDVVNSLVVDLRRAVTPGFGAPPLTLDDKIRTEEQYQRLRILWQLRNSDTATEFASAVDAQRTGRPADDLFRIVDDLNWRQLKTADSNLVVEGPKDTLDPPQAYDLVTFRLATANHPLLLGSYLAQRKLSYIWTISIETHRRKSWRRRREIEAIGKLQVISSEPQLAQYSPVPGQIVVEEVLARYGADPESAHTRKPSDPVTIRKSRDFSILGVAAGADYIAFGVAALAGLVSGLMIYAQAPTFGGLKDYLSLFTFGAGFDQGKNFLQALGGRKT